MFLEIGDRVLIKEKTFLSKIIPFKLNKYDWIANVISPKGDIIDCSPPTFTKEKIEKYLDTSKYDVIVLRPNPNLTVAQKAIWVRKIKMLENKRFLKKKTKDINNIETSQEMDALSATLIADQHCSKLKDQVLNKPDDYLKLVKSGEFIVLFDSLKG